MIEGSCHCGQVRFAVDEPPTALTACNCSICRRLGWIMAYYEVDQVRISEPGGSPGYIQGDRHLASFHCSTCGCPTYWKGLGEHAHRIGLNARLFDPDVLQGVTVRFLDGADTWEVYGEAPFSNRMCCT
jgi:hypothetical protein